MRKRLGIATICMLLLAGCGNSNEALNTTDKIETTDTAENTNEQSKATETENKEGYKRYRFGIGETAEFEDGLAITLVETGKYVESYYEKNNICTYISLEIENRGSENIVFSSANIEFYGDGYLLDTGIVLNAEDVLGTIELSPGRRAKGRVFAECEEYDSLSVIEAEYSNVIFVVKNQEDYEPIGDDGVEVMFVESIYQMSGTYTDMDGNGIMVSIEQNENSLADITFLTEGNEPDYVFEDCCPVDNLLLFEIYADNQVIYISLEDDGNLSVSGCEKETYNKTFMKTNTIGNSENIGTATPKEQIFSGGKEDYPIYVYRRDTEYITISRYIFMGDFTDLVDITLKSEVGDSSGQKELEVRRPSFEEDEYSLTFCDWEYDSFNDPIVIEFAGDMSYIDVTANWNANVTDEQSFYAGHYELENIYSEEEYVNLYLLD